MTPTVIDIPYLPHSAQFVHAIKELPGLAWLDSGRPQQTSGRYDIITAQPAATIQTKGGETLTRYLGGQALSQDNPLEVVESYLEPIKTNLHKDLPFCGGALGYWSYDLSQQLGGPRLTARDKTGLPLMEVGIYSWALVQDHHQQRAWLFCLPACPASLKKDLQYRFKALKPWESLSFGAKPKFKVGVFSPSLSKQEYGERLNQIDDYIVAGDCYQVNFAQHFQADFEGESLGAYEYLRSQLPSPFSAYLSLTEGAILSFSPERFLQLAGSAIQTKPIKGTAPRKKNTEEDQIVKEALLESTKDRAENLMIVDLLRNDLSKCSELGSVRVPELFALESYANVHHLVSTVTATLKESVSPLQLFKHCFPGGSITGAPKRRAMEIIDELENCARSVYCGSVGYVSANGNMDTNIAIRTLVLDPQGRLHCWGGGGIVADSNPLSEYKESLDKISPLLTGLSQIDFNE